MIPETALEHLPCTALKGVGAKLAEQLGRCGIHTIQDLLFHLPLRYQDRTHITPIHELKPGDQAVIEGWIEAVEITKGPRQMLLCRLRDNTGLITLRFFHFYATQRQQLQPGTKLSCFGEVRGRLYALEIIHPEYHLLAEQQAVPLAKELTPIYPSTEGLSQSSLRKLTEQALAGLKQGKLLTEFLPDIILKEFQLMPLTAALLWVHRPPPDVVLSQLLNGNHPAQQRLAFEELLAHQLALQQLRARIQRQMAPSLPLAPPIQQALLASLPFQLTEAQQRVLHEIEQDLQRPKPMLRLVQGDVGSGKTIVAALAALQAVAAGYQAVLMAPTELLAEQHYANFCQWLEPLGIKLAWLAGKLKGKARQAALQSLASGEAQLIVGTHALFQAGVDFSALGLVIIDEQHRFGVHQRLALRAKGKNICPHQLIMTATPIPRTLAMVAYADLDQSIIDELPPGRTPVTTVVISNDKRHEMIERIEHAVQQQRQVYWVCTLIEESEVLQCQAAEATATELMAALPMVKIGLVHGRMKPADKQAIMARFKARELDLLVATTVIEVGVDVPNASMMVIENPERLGLAQLHQLRGRVGRGAVASFCVLLYQAPLSQLAKSRLKVMRETNDGFVIAQHDLELRGPGEVLGTRQTGLVSFKIADLIRDQALLPKVQAAAERLMAMNAADACEALIKRWLGASVQYGEVG